MHLYLLPLPLFDPETTQLGSEWPALKTSGQKVKMFFFANNSVHTESWKKLKCSLFYSLKVIMARGLNYSFKDR